MASSRLAGVACCLSCRSEGLCRCLGPALGRAAGMEPHAWDLGAAALSPPAPSRPRAAPRCLLQGPSVGHGESGGRPDINPAPQCRPFSRCVLGRHAKAATCCTSQCTQTGLCSALVQCHVSQIPFPDALSRGGSRREPGRVLLPHRPVPPMSAYRRLRQRRSCGRRR